MLRIGLPLLVFLCTALTACGPDQSHESAQPSSTSPGEGELTIYSGRSESLAGPLIERFEEQT